MKRNTTKVTGVLAGVTRQLKRLDKEIKSFVVKTSTDQDRSNIYTLAKHLKMKITVRKIRNGIFRVSKFGGSIG